MYCRFTVSLGRICDCIIATNGQGALNSLRLPPFGWTSITVTVNTAGLEVGPQHRVIWLKISSDNGDISLQPIWIRFYLEKPSNLLP